MQSPELKDLAKALAAAQSSLSAAAKDGNNPHFKSKYATLQSVWDAAKEVLAPNGLSVVQTFAATDGHRMDITTTLLHVSGQYIAGTLSMVPQRADPQGIGSAITYGRRYALAAILGIVADEDDDGNAASQPGQTKAPSKPFIETRGSYTPPANMVPPPAPPAPKPAISVPRDADAGRDSSWKAVVVPPFIKKHAGKTLGDLPVKDITWWAQNYEPRPYKGEIQQKDVDFKEALMAGAAAYTFPDEPKVESARNAAAQDEADVPF